MATVIKTTFKLRRGQSHEWISVNPVLASGEPGFATDTFDLKIGNGKDKWQDLPSLSRGEYSLSPDGKTLAYNENNELSVIGFTDAEINSVPIKNEKGEMIWIPLAPVALSGLIEDLEQKDIILISGGSASDIMEEEEQ